MSIPIPKQFKHWCRLNGIYPATRRSSKCYYYYSKRHAIHGRYRHFRIANDGMLDICDGYFDKWGNSRGYSCAMPKSKSEFETVMKVFDAMAEIDNPGKESIEHMMSFELEMAEKMENEKREILSEYNELMHYATWSRPSLAFQKIIPQWKRRMEKNIRRLDRRMKDRKADAKWYKKSLALAARTEGPK